MMRNRQAETGFFQNCSGATLVEYGVALIVVIVVGAATMQFLGNAVGDQITETVSAF